MTQDILSALDSDEVNSIDDTVEAYQVATVLKNVYLAMAANRNWEGQKKLITFEHSASLELPTHLKAPASLKELHFFKYNWTKDGNTFEMKDVLYKHPDEFLRLVANRGVNTPHTRIITDPGGTPLVVITNKPPSYWTSFDDTYIVCDSYDAQVDDTLKSSKSQLHVTLYPTFEMSDSFIPHLPVEAFPSLEAEAKSVAFVEIKQVANQKAEQESVRQRTWLARKNWQLAGGVRYPNYGRKGTK